MMNGMFAGALGFLTDAEIINRFALQANGKPVSKRRAPFQGKRVIAENSSIKKRMRSVDGFAEVKISPARRRKHWHATKRWAWRAISTLATDLEKDRERRRLMRYAT